MTGRRAFLSFFIYRTIYHPLSFAKTVFNVLKGVAETKTESYMRTFIKRARSDRASPDSPLRWDPVAPYSGDKATAVLLQSNAHYAYSNSWLKGVAVVFGHFASMLLARR